jgi:hypothetical protein
MQEAIALRDLHATGTDAEKQDVADELRAAAIYKLQQLNAIRGQLLRQAERVLETARRIKTGRQGVGLKKEVESLEHAAHQVATMLAVIAEDEER